MDQQIDDGDDDDDDDFRERRPSSRPPNRSFSKFDRDRYPPRSRSEPRFYSQNNAGFEEDSGDEANERSRGPWRGGRDDQRRNFDFRRPKNNQYNNNNNSFNEDDDFRRPSQRDFIRERKDFRPSNSSTTRKPLDDKDIFDL